MRAKIIAFTLVLVFLLASAAFADKAITSIEVGKKTDCITITVQGNAALDMSVLKSTAGRYVGFHFPCKLVAKGRVVGVHSGKIYNIRYSNFSANPAASRVVVNTTGHVDYATKWAANRQQVEITVWKNGKTKKSESSKQIKTPEPDSAVMAESTRATHRIDARIRPQTPVLYACASTSAMPSLSTEPITKVLGVAEVAESASTAVPKNVENRSAGRSSFNIRSNRVALADLARASRYRVSPQKQVSLNFLAADINDVLKALSVQSGHNIVAGKDVEGNVTVSLSNVTVDQALDYVAKLSGYSYSKENETYLVGSKDSLRTLENADEHKPNVEVVALNFAKGDDVIALLKTQYADVQANATDLTKANKASAGSLLVLSGPREQVLQAAQLANTIENSLQSQANGNVTEVYNLKYVSPFEMKTALAGLVPEVVIALAPSDGFDLLAPSGIRGAGGDASGGATVETQKITKNIDELGRIQALILTGPESSVERAMNIAEKLDVKTPQIKFDAKVTSINTTGEKNLGLKWEWGDISFLEDLSAPLVVEDEDLGASYSISENISKDMSLKRWFRQPFDFGAVLDALVTDGDAEVLASPSLICMEGKPGVFFVGDEVTYIQRIEQTSTGQNIITDAKQVGVQLRVNSDVSPDGTITMNLHPEVSTLKLSVEEGVTLPIVSRRFTDHVVRVKDGQTIVVGGLIRNDEIEQMSKVPLLGDIPFLGKLFRHQSTSSEHTEVVMFITASIVED